jgi:hypothetical protein
MKNQYKEFTTHGTVILATQPNKIFVQDDINETIKQLRTLFLKLNDGKLSKEQKRCLTSLYNQMTKATNN